MANYYLTFNGTNQYGAANGYKGVTGSSACTIMGWFKTTETDSDNTLISWGTGSTFARRYLKLEAGVLWDRLVTDTVSGGSNLGDGQWHHFAMVNPASASTSQFLIYIDGVSVTVNTTTSGGTINIISGDDVSIGALNGSSNYFKGSLDDFRLYNTVLTAQQISDLYNDGTEPPTTNLQAKWLMNDGSGNLVANTGAVGISLLLANSPTWTRYPIIIVKDSGGMAIDDDDIDPINFGTTAQNETALTQDFTITNNGDDDLIISSISTPTGFSVSGISLPATILTSAEESFTVTLSTATVGTFSGDIVIEENDPDIFDFNFAITGEIIEPQNIVIKDNLGTTIADGEATPQDFGSVDQGATAPALTFTIQNTGEATLTISSITLPSGYSISGATPSTIAGNSTDTFTVELSTATVGTFAGDIEVNSDDPDTAVYNFAITGVINLSTPDTTLEEALITFLAAKGDLPTIYPVRLPREATKPAITVWRWGGGGDHSLSGATNSGTAYIQCSIWSNTTKEAKDYAKTLRGYLQNYYGLMGGRFIFSIVAEDELETYEPPVEGQQQGTIQLICQYTIRHKEPLPSLSEPTEAITDAIVDIGLTDYIKTTLAVDMYSAGFPHESITLPGIIYRRAGNKHYHSLTGAVNKALVTFEFDCHAGTMKEAVALGESLRLILQGFRGVLDGCKINSVLYKTQKQKYIRPLVGDGGRFICTMEFDALVNE